MQCDRRVAARLRDAPVPEGEPLVPPVAGRPHRRRAQACSAALSTAGSRHRSPSSTRPRQRHVLSAIVGSTAALTGFVVTVSVLVVQMATGTFSARYMRLLVPRPPAARPARVLVGTFTFSFTLLAGVESARCRTSGYCERSADGRRTVPLPVLPRPLHSPPAAGGRRRARRPGREAGVRVGRGPPRPTRPRSSGPVESGTSRPLSCAATGPARSRPSTVPGLVRFARERECTLVLTHAVGDFVTEGAPVILVYGGGDLDRSAERELRGMLVLGVERTIEQDPAFALRIMVDIAIRRSPCGQRSDDRGPGARSPRRDAAPDRRDRLDAEAR